MKFIALEEHVLPRDLAAEAGIPASGLRGMLDLLDDVAETRLPAMDKAGIDLQVLSVPINTLGFLDAEEAARVARKFNDRVHTIVDGYPERFRAFALLPLSDPPAAARELHRAVQDLGFLGAIISGQTNGVFLDDPIMEPVLAAAESLNVPLYLHPAPPPPAVATAYFSGLPGPVARVLATSAWGWHAETGMHVLRMAASGTFNRHPQLRIIVGHMGENLPFSLARADAQLNPVTGLSQSVAEIVTEHVWLTTSGYTTAPPLRCAAAVFGTDRMLFSVDYPYCDSSQATDFLTEAPLDPTDFRSIAYLNAEKLLGL